MQQRLFRLAVSDLALTAHHVPGEGWSLVVTHHRQGEPFDNEQRGTYSRLTTEELIDVIECEVSGRLTGS